MRILLILGIAALMGGSAASAEGSSAELAAPVDREAKIVKDGTIWTCEGTSCAAKGAVETPNRLMRACREISRQAGEVASIESGDLSLDAEALAECNG